jgi:hypothetical protein
MNLNTVSFALVGKANKFSVISTKGKKEKESRGGHFIKKNAHSFRHLAFAGSKLEVPVLLFFQASLNYRI